MNGRLWQLNRFPIRIFTTRARRTPGLVNGRYRQIKQFPIRRFTKRARHTPTLAPFASNHSPVGAPAADLIFTQPQLLPHSRASERLLARPILLLLIGLERLEKHAGIEKAICTPMPSASSPPTNELLTKKKRAETENEKGEDRVKSHSHPPNPSSSSSSFSPTASSAPTFFPNLFPPPLRSSLSFSLALLP